MRVTGKATKKPGTSGNEPVRLGTVSVTAWRFSEDKPRSAATKKRSA